MNRPLLVTADTRVHASSWMRAATALGIAIAVLLACYWQTVHSLVWVWAHDGTYQYAFLIFPLSAWLVFDLRHRLQASPPRPSVWGLAAVAVLAAIWYAGHLLDVNLVQHFAFVWLFPALVLAFWGWRALRVLVFPLAYLVVFAVPWGDGLVGPLQDITARFAVHAMDVTGIPALINGREIITPSAVWMVEQACSGVKFFIACTALGCLYGYLMYRHAWKRVLFVVLAAIVPVIANGLRVYFTVLIGETFGLKYATGTDHMIFGWQFFGTVLVLLLLAGWFFRDRPAPRQPLPERITGRAGARAGVWPVAIALLVAAPVTAAALAPVATPVQALHLAAPALAGWTGPQLAAEPWKPSFHGAAGQFQAGYRSSRSGAAVEFFHAVYAGKSRSGHDLITYGNDVYDPAKARVLATADRRLVFADGRDVTARELRLADRDGSRLVWYWYCVDRRCTASPVLVKVLQAFDVLRGRAPASSVWALSSLAIGGNDDAVRAHLRVFARALPGPGAPGASTHDEKVVAGERP